jgi:hypothetical protein
MGWGDVVMLCALDGVDEACLRQPWLSMAWSSAMTSTGWQMLWPRAERWLGLARQDHHRDRVHTDAKERLCTTPLPLLSTHAPLQAMPETTPSLAQSLVRPSHHER